MTAEQLHAEALQIVANRSMMSAADYHRAAQQKAIAISDYLSFNGELLDKTNPDLVTALGKDVDALANGAYETLESVQQSPAWEGTKAGVKDAWDRLNRWVGGDPNNKSPVETWGRRILVGLGLWLGIEALRTFRK